MLSSLDVRKANFNPVLQAPTVVAKAATLQPRRDRLSPVAALGFFRKRIATSGAVDDILAVVQDTERGCCTSKSQRASIDAAVGVLEGAGNDGRPVNKSLSATWKLLWTTEKVGFPAASVISTWNSDECECVAGNLVYLAKCRPVPYKSRKRVSGDELLQQAYSQYIG